MRLYLVRHGRTASNVAGLLDTAYPGPSLDAVGRAQASALVGRLEGVELDAIYCSDIRRAYETAEPLADARRVMARPLPGLREVPAGEWEMSPDWHGYLDVFRRWGEGDVLASCPGGESWTRFEGRFSGAIGTIAKAGHDAALAVSHAAALQCWLSAVLPAGSIAGRALGNTGIVTLDGEPGAWMLSGWDAGVTDDTPFYASDPDAS